MSNQALIEITGAAQATVEVVEGTPPVVEVSAPATPVTVELIVQGPQGPIGSIGPTGIVTAATPLSYDANARSLSITLAPVATSGVYGDLTDKPTLGTAAATDASAYATTAQGAKADTAVQPATLATGLAGKADLVNGLVPSAQLPSYVDDVLEFANVAAFPATGETGKIYVSLATNRCYRWSGSIYVEIAASPGSTDAVPEGSVNLYFTTGRAAAAAPVQSVAGRTGNVTLSSSDVSGLGTAAAQNVGTSAGNVVQLDGSARLPAVDGSALTGIVTTTDLGYTPSTRVLTSSTGADVTLPLVSGTDPGLLSAVDKLKLDGIAAGAEVNVNADWNASSGDAQILNKPTLGTAAAQNVGTAADNVVQLDGSARLPAVDGSALTGIVTTTNLSYTPSTRLLESSTGTDVTLPLFATNSTDAGLVPGNSSASTTQFLRGDGTWATPAGGFDALVDATTTANTIYTGQALVGTAQSAASWTIVRTTYSAAGVRLTKGTAAGVTWTGRTSATYT